jgi:hypothetical protein
MNIYKLYHARLIKGILMYDWVADESADNIIEAEHLFESKMTSGDEYVITIKKQ